MKTNIVCILSDKALENLQSRFPNRVGTIAGESRDGRCYGVIWAGTKTRHTYHKSFIHIMEVVKDINHLKALAADIKETFCIITPTGIIGSEVTIKYFTEEQLFTLLFHSDDRMFSKITEQELAEKTQIINLIDNQKLYV